MLDIQQIFKDLAAMRSEKKLSQRDFEEQSGVTRWTIQVVERGEGSLDVEDLRKWLEFCGTNLQLYLSQYLTESEKGIVDKERELYAYFRRYMKIPERREAIAALLTSFARSDERFAKLQKRSRGRKPGQTGGRSEG